MAIAEALDHPPTLGLAHHCWGFHDHFAGRWASGLAHFEQAAAIFWEAGDSRRSGAAAVRAAWLLQFTGRLAESRARGLELVRVGRDGGDHQVWGWGLVMVGSDLRIEGALDDAIVHLQQAAEMLEAVPEYVWVGISRAELGQCYLRQMKVGQAVATFEECNEHVAAHGVSGHFAGPPETGWRRHT